MLINQQRLKSTQTQRLDNVPSFIYFSTTRFGRFT
jgi:hypothetical protein